MRTTLPRTETELVELLHAIDAPAPGDLHARVDTLVLRRRRRSRTQRVDMRSRPVPTRGWRIAGAVAAIVVAGALAVGMHASGTAPLTLRTASALTLSRATLAAPTESPGRPAKLAASVDGLAFPYWQGNLGWHSTGARADQIAGRSVTTVFYEDRLSRRVGYAIVAGTPALPIAGGHLTWSHGVTYRALSGNGVQAIAWNRDGHLCVIAGRDVGTQELLRLAAADNV
jgi:anti-sigma factor RsiW